MEITVTKSTVASPELVKEAIDQQIYALGYKIEDGYIVEKEPLKVEDIIQGFLFKKTYHRWWWKAVANVKKEEVGKGKYKLYIECPKNSKFLNDIELFVNGIKERLDDLKEHIEIILVRVPEFPGIRTDNVPYYGYY